MSSVDSKVIRGTAHGHATIRLYFLIQSGKRAFN